MIKHMNILIINDNLLLSKALNRYLKFVLLQTNTTMISFAELKTKIISQFSSFDLIISDVYENSNCGLINYGIQYGELMENGNVNIIFIFTKNKISEEYTYDNLPPNCYFLPLHLDLFLKSLNKLHFNNNYDLLKDVFKSNPFTSTH